MTRIYHVFLWAIALILSVSCVKETDDSVVPDNDDRHTSLSQFIEGEANVLFTEEMVQRIEEETVGDILSETGIVRYERLFPDAGEYEERTRREGLHRWYKVVYDKSLPMTKAYETLESLDFIETFVPARKMKLTGFFNDPKLDNQWHYYNPGVITQAVAGADINVETVWQDYTVGDRSVVVAVIDQGVDGDHEDLSLNYIGGLNFVTNGGKVTPDDHGTHVAGTIAAVNNNGIGVCGVAGGDALNGIKGVGILSCQIFAGNKSTGAAAAALKWAADNGAVIANNSWGYVFDSFEQAKNSRIDDELKAAIDYFIKYAGCDNAGNQLPDSPMKGGLVVFAAGNDAWEYNPICEYEPVLSVGSIAPDYSRAYYSCYGDWVDLAAPGGSAKYTRGQVLSTLSNNMYGEMQGTSMACPHVSGVAALVVSYFGGQGFTVDMLKERLIEGSRKDVLPLSAKIGPLVDALGAITYGGKIAPDPVNEFDVNVVGNKVSVSLNVTEDKDDVKPYRYLVMFSEDAVAIGNAVPENAADVVTIQSFRIGNIQPGKRIDLVVEGTDFCKDYYLKMYAADYAGNFSEASQTRKITTGVNNPPVMTYTDNADGVVLKSHESFATTVSIYDPEGGDVKVSLSSGLSGASLASAGVGVWKLNVNGIIAVPGKYNGEIVAEDIHGLKTSLKISYEVLKNNSPVVADGIGGIFRQEYGETVSFDLTRCFADPDGEILSFKVTEGNKNVAKAVIEGDELKLSLTGYGYTTITVTASDARKSSAKMDIPVMIKTADNLVELYPIPVKTVLNVRTGDEAMTEIILETMTGKRVLYRKESVSAFSPYVMDCSGLAPGRYQAIVSFNGNTYKKVITKL